MTIGFVIGETFPAFSETFVSNRVLWLCEAGQEVVVLAGSGPVDDVSRQRLREVRQRARVIHGCGPLALSPSAPIALLQGAFRASQSIAVGPTRVARLAAGVWGEGGRTRSALRGFLSSASYLRSQVDLYHVNFAHNALPLIPIGKYLRIPLVVSVLGYDMVKVPEGRPRLFEELFHEAALFLCSSHYLLQLAAALGCPTEKLRVCYPEIDADFFRFVDRRQRRSEVVEILCVGRLHRNKGHLIALEAVRQLHERHKNIRYRIVGEGPERESLEREIANLGLSSVVELLGVRNSVEIRDLMEESDIFFLASVSEPFGVVLVEAQATGLPVVATKVGGIPEAVQDGKSAILVPPGDSSAAAAALARLVEDRSLRGDLGEGGRAWAVASFSKDVMLGQLLRHYAQAREFYG